MFCLIGCNRRLPDYFTTPGRKCKCRRKKVCFPAKQTRKARPAGTYKMHNTGACFARFCAACGRKKPVWRAGKLSGTGILCKITSCAGCARKELPHYKGIQNSYNERYRMCPCAQTIFGRIIRDSVPVPSHCKGEMLYEDHPPSGAALLGRSRRGPGPDGGPAPRAACWTGCKNCSARKRPLPRPARRPLRRLPPPRRRRPAAAPLPCPPTTPTP